MPLVAPLPSVSVLLVERLPVLASTSVPLLTVVPPAYVFAPAKVDVPLLP